MNPDELGLILHRLVPAVKAATGVQRVHYLAVMERAPHFHLWPPRTATRSAAGQMARQIREHFEQS